jgi:type I restriction enzyme M protein
LDTFLSLRQTPESIVLDNTALGYWKIIVDRPLRLYSQLSPQSLTSLMFVAGDKALRSKIYDRLGDSLFENFGRARTDIQRILTEESGERDDVAADVPAKPKVSEKVMQRLLDLKGWQRGRRLSEVGFALRKELGGEVFHDHNTFRTLVDQALVTLGERLSGGDRSMLLRAVSWTDELAPPVIARVLKKQPADPLHGRFKAEVNGKECVVEYEHDPDLRDSEQIPLLEPGGIEAFVMREVMPYTPDAWFDENKTLIGYEISFSRYFHRARPLRSLEEIRADILAIDRESEELLHAVVGAGDS